MKSALDLDDAIFLAERYGEPIPGAVTAPTPPLPPAALGLLPEHAHGSCTLCACHARVELFGFRVCSYHAVFGEDDPPCPVCAVESGR